MTAIYETHLRRCWDCGTTNEHTSRITPGVLCPNCGSQDTRPVKPASRKDCDDVIDYPNERDCEHGHKRGKCVACDLIESESRVRELEATLAARTESLEAALASRAAMEEEIERLRGSVHDCPQCGESCTECRCAESERDTLRAECDRLRGLVREAAAGMAKIADHGKGFTDEQMHLRIYAATYYRWAKDEAADLVARLGAE